MKHLNLLLMAATMTCGACGSIQNSDTPDAENLIQRSDIRIETAV